MDMVLPSGGTYQVNAYINDYSLDECSIIKANDTIRPYFVNSVVHDPDVRGLVVFLQDDLGQDAGKKIWYTLGTGLTSSPETIEKPVIPEPAPVAPSPQTSPPVPVIPAVDVPAEPEDSPALIESPAPEEPETPGKAKPTPSLPKDVDMIEELPSPTPVAEPVVPETPEIDIPKGAESRNYALMSPGKRDQVIRVARLDQVLPAYKLTDSLELGRYTLMFQVLGEKTVLAAIERPVYFLGDATLTFDDIQRYLPGFSKTAQFVPPGVNVLIEAQVIADTRLDPYVIWYSGNKRIDEGKLSENAGSLFWKAPDRTGFYTIKAVLFPFKPPNNTPLYGKSKELSLPVSVKSEMPEYFSDRADQFIHWYQFQNNLLDAQDPKDPNRSLRPKTQLQARWVPHGSIYGLSIGPEDVYLLPSAPFLLADNEQGNAQIFFRSLLLAQGSIFKMVFRRADTSAAALDGDLVFNGETLLLRISAGAASYETALLPSSEEDESAVTPSPILQTGDFVAFSLSFTIQHDRFTARIYLEERDMQSKPCTLTLAAPISGEGTFQFGSELPLIGSIPEAKTPSAVALFDEVGISFTKTPIPLIPSRQNEALPELR
jgi:hypothetical protein